jgi:hypothetical protein
MENLNIKQEKEFKEKQFDQENQRQAEQPNLLRASMGFMRETQYRFNNSENSNEKQSNEYLRGSHNTFIQSRVICTSDSDSSDQEIESDSDDSDGKEGYREIKTLVTEKYRYIGESRNNKRDGFGVCYYTNGDKYSGYWEDDMKSGLGRLTLKNGKIFCGEFSDNSIDGFVEYVNNQKVVHHGYMRGFKFIPGEPLIMRNSKCRFQGRMKYSDGKLTGIGKFKYSNGSVYEGEICDYAESGLGIYYRTDGYVFKGENKERIFNGFCEVTCPDKSIQFAYYKNNIKDGLCISISSEGVYSVGVYLDDIRNGGSLLISKECTKFEIWLFGFCVKQIEKKENIIGYVNTVYPEYKYLLKLKNNVICNVLKQ